MIIPPGDTHPTQSHPNQNVFKEQSTKIILGKASAATDQMMFRNCSYIRKNFVRKNFVSPSCEAEVRSMICKEILQVKSMFFPSYKRCIERMQLTESFLGESVWHGLTQYSGKEATKRLYRKHARVSKREG